MYICIKLQRAVPNLLNYLSDFVAHFNHALSVIVPVFRRRLSTDLPCFGLPEENRTYQSGQGPAAYFKGRTIDHREKILPPHVRYVP